jgi:hypothetical protein
MLSDYVSWIDKPQPIKTSSEEALKAITQARLAIRAKDRTLEL